MHKVTFQPEGFTIRVPDLTTVLEAAQRAGIALNAVCAGAGTCKKCLVLLNSSNQPVPACQIPVTEDLMVTIPETSRFFEQKILEEGISTEAKLDPCVRKYHLKIPKPDLADLRSDAQRLIESLTAEASESSGAFSLSPSVLRELSQVLRQSDFEVTAVCHQNRILALEPGDTTDVNLGLAMDVGTTTVVASLVNLIDGQTMATASQTNPQISFGDDVISRIQYSTTQNQGLQQLQDKIINGINELIARICAQAKVNPQQIFEMTAAGNATMQHLFLGVPVAQIAQAPYVAAFSEAANVPAAPLNLQIHPEANVFVMPGVAAHVGGDTVAVALAAALRHSETINLAIDIGTNGEILLGNRDRLLACSTAAGPAFEGARIRQGMRAATGAIDHVRIQETVEINVIGDAKPIGLCGSGLIDAVAELLRHGILDPSGKLLSPDELTDTLNPELRKRIITFEKQTAFVLATSEQTGQSEPVLLTQRDLREVQLAKAAIAAGIRMLITELQIEVGDIDHVYLAGAFGNYIQPDAARRIGLLPDLEATKIQPIGNAAFAGAREVLLSREARRHGEQLARQIQYVELAGRSDFQDLFTQHLFFPNE
jgi:uncharacterized 2Fe-2S/4Fe-4S cluster protein (DUF4445 family)